MNVLLNGAMGKMGNELINAINKNDDFTIVCGFDKEDYFDGDFPVYSNIEDIKGNVDVTIFKKAFYAEKSARQKQRLSGTDGRRDGQSLPNPLRGRGGGTHFFRDDQRKRRPL